MQQFEAPARYLLRRNLAGADVSYHVSAVATIESPQAPIHEQSGSTRRAVESSNLAGGYCYLLH